MKTKIVISVLGLILLLIIYYYDKIINVFSNSELLIETLLKTTKIGEFSLIALIINIGVFLFAALIEICAIGWKSSSLNRFYLKGQVLQMVIYGAG